MEPPVQFRVLSKNDVRLAVLFRASPALLFIAGALAVVALFGRRGEPLPESAVWPFCGLLCFGLTSIALLLPLAGKRIAGLAEMRGANEDLHASRRLIEAGRPEEAAEKLSVTASRLVGKLHAYHVVVSSSAGVAYALAGQTELGLGILDAIERSGWLQALALRAHRDTVLSSTAMLRAITGDVPGAERALAGCGTAAATADLVRLARVITAVRAGAADARAQIGAALSSGAVTTVRGRGTLLAIDGALAAAAGDTEGDARIAAELATLRPRLFAHFRAGWPEVASWLSRHGISDATAG